MRLSTRREHSTYLLKVVPRNLSLSRNLQWCLDIECRVLVRPMEVLCLRQHEHARVFQHADSV